MKFTLILPTLSRVRFFDTQLEGYQVRLTQFFNITLQRWMLNVENKTLNTQSLGIVMNQGVDLLDASGDLNLQALVLTNNTNIVGHEADPSNLGTDLVLAYMDLETYQEFILDGALVGRSVYRVNANGE